MPEDTTTVGPVEWVALTFPGPALDPRLVPPLNELIEPGTVRLLDAAVLHRRADGVVIPREVQDEGIAAFDTVDGDVLELLSEEDLASIAAGLPRDTTTLVLVWENRWAAGFAAAIRRAGGVLAAHDRIPPDRADAALRRSTMEGAPA
jgi:hypothetical protein